MDDVMANTILKELREFRTENNKRWDENDKRWEQNDKRWEQNDRRWEENDRRWKENKALWEENSKRWDENEKRWEENSKRWDENEKRWEENSKRWDENNKRWNENNERWQKNTNSLVAMNERIANLEEGRKQDRREIAEILDTMQKSISEQFVEMREHFDAQFEKIFTLQRINDIEHDEFKKLLYTHEKRINFQSARLENLEEWKEEFDMGEVTAV
jgi:chromosome segregation ATPase